MTPCDDDPYELGEAPEALAPGAGGDPYCNLTVAAQQSCVVIVAAAHALYFHRHRLGGAAERETSELLAALDRLREAAEFLRPAEFRAELTGTVVTGPAPTIPAGTPAWTTHTYEET